MSRLAPALAVLSCLLLGGCLDTRQGLRPPPGQNTVSARQSKADEVEFFARWRRVALGFKPKDTFVGYLRSENTRRIDKVRTTHVVYNLRFERMGFFTDMGVTFRLNKAGDYERLGIFELPESVTQILGGEGPVNFYEMPPPEGSGLPFRDELDRTTPNAKGKT